MDVNPTIFAAGPTAATLRTILRGVLAVLGMWRLELPHMLLLHRRIAATGRGIERLLARYRAGRLWRVARRARGQCQRAHLAASVMLPRRFGWLVQAGGHQAAGFGAQLQAVLNTPDMVALLAASPQAGRMLRPLCRALAVDLPGRLVTSPELAAKSGATPPRTCGKRSTPPPFRIALPRGVLAASRRQGFGKLC